LLAVVWGGGELEQPEQSVLNGRFYYKDGTTYEGQYKMIGLPAASSEPAKKGAKKKEDESPPQPTEPPRPLRHGTGAWCWGH